MSDKKNGEQERFSIEDIIAEIKGEQAAKPRTEETPEKDDLPDLLIPEARIKQLHTEPEDGQNGQADPAPEKEPVVYMPPRKPRPEPQPEAEPEGDVIVDDQELATDKAPGRRVILFKSHRVRTEDSGDEEEDEEIEEEEKFDPYPVSDDDEEYYVEEEYYEEEEEELLYDFLNIPFDDPTRAVKKLGRKLMVMSGRLICSLVLLACAGYLTFGTQLGLPALPAIEGLGSQVLPSSLLGLCIFLSLLCGWEVTTSGIWRLIKLRPTWTALWSFRP